MLDKELRQKIISDDGNIIISAGAGSGKTHILVEKILYEVKNSRSHYKIAAITFTRKAANEIKQRIGGDLNGHFVGTNDTFVDNEIIRPFIKDALGTDFPSEYEVVYTRKSKFYTFEEGINNLKNHHKLGTYFNNQKNFKFQLALKILKKSKVARQYIKAKYQRLFIDEYQDCDQDMHNLFIFIQSVLKVKLFIVGDPKQSIYEWRGAKPELFKNLYESDNDFRKYKLTVNFRCSPEIQNYSNVFLEETKGLYKNICETPNNVIGVLGNCLPIDLFDLKKEIAILVRKNDEAKQICEILNKMGNNFVYIPKTPLDNLGTQNSYIFIELAKYNKDNLYSIYDFINEIPREIDNKQIREFNKILKPLKEEKISEEKIEEIVINLFSILDLSVDIKELEAFSEVILSEEFDNAYNGKKFLHRVMTIHSSKGLEFDQVMIFASHFDLISGKDLNEHYVATTRGKEMLIVMLDSPTYIQNLYNIVKSLKLSLENIIKITKCEEIS
ncbi:ATP-dependent helicase [Calidifontibacillus erzurumensis]|uniref:DNA 3'-5' helicase n=1 Tax=Calidifontibacillus erzurumensis TaxID=2741433 RepID=A0A8J8GDH2_9BACI|nr:ATP-dependent helicase [Calidifontibacillus erzurumensis]NSL51885.1 ATP-dependent helicase [Calidifontibacillus erzurumensis]